MHLAMALSEISFKLMSFVPLKEPSVNKVMHKVDHNFIGLACSKIKCLTLQCLYESCVFGIRVIFYCINKLL